MQYNLSENIHKITDQFIDSKVPAKEEDKLLFERYMVSFREGETRMPVFKGTEGAVSDYPVLTQYGFAKLSIDNSYMEGFYVPRCKELAITGAAGLNENEKHLLRASLIEFALLGCLEAQKVLFEYFGGEWDYLSEVVTRRWPNLQRLDRFLAAQSGAGHYEDFLPTYSESLSDVKAGGKRKHWIWYIFPQMYGIPGTHSGNSLYYGIRGRMEATQYICHPLLRQRMIELCSAILQTGKSVCEIFPEMDARKVQSSINLFASVSDIPELKEVKKRNNWI